MSANAGPTRGRTRGAALPDFPWDLLKPAKAIAAGHPDGLIDLSMGTPVDPVPANVQAALAGAADAPGYPLTAGSAELRAAITDWVATTCGASGDVGVVPTIGSKEFIAGLPMLLGLGPGDEVVIPRLCYPTYEVGALLAGCRVVRADSLVSLGPTSRVRLIWINSPSNPTGQVLPSEHLHKVVTWARDRGAVVASDECYLPLGGEVEPRSVLSVCDGDYRGVLAVHSLSKRSNLAGYRAGFVAGDPALLAELLEVRKHAGLIVPQPVQAAMVAALRDEAHALAQRATYMARRRVLRAALQDVGFTVAESAAGLYCWATRDEDCWSTVEWLAHLGIVVAPGVFYGPTGERHIRVALTATDEQIAAAARRLRAVA